MFAIGSFRQHEAHAILARLRRVEVSGRPAVARESGSHAYYIPRGPPSAPSHLPGTSDYIYADWCRRVV